MGALCRPLLLLCHVAYFSWFYAEPMENQLRMAIREANVQDVNGLARVHADVWASVFDGIATGMSDDDASSPIGSISPATADFVAGTYDRSLRHFTDVFAGKIPATVWLAIVDGQLAGFAEAEAKGPHEVRFLEVSLLYVLPEFHGRGVGSALLQRAIGDAPAYVWTRSGLPQQFYEKHGFVADGTQSELAGMKTVRLIR